VRAQGPRLGRRRAAAGDGGEAGPLAHRRVDSWFEIAPHLCEGTAPCPSLSCLEAYGSPTHPSVHPRQRRRPGGRSAGSLKAARERGLSSLKQVGELIPSPALASPSKRRCSRFQQGAWNALGECYWQRGELDAARGCFRGALAHRRTCVLQTLYFYTILLYYTVLLYFYISRGCFRDALANRARAAH
jgi:hypothetical protein